MFFAPPFGGTQNLNIWSAHLTGGSGGIRFDDGLDLPIGKFTGGSGGIRFRILSIVSDFKVLSYSLTIFELVTCMGFGDYRNDNVIS